MQNDAVLAVDARASRSETAPIPDGSVAGRRHALRSAFGDLLAARSLAWQLFRRDFAARYRESFLGYAWAVLPPLMLAVTATLAARAQILNVGSSSVPYPVLVAIGTALWQSFSEALTGPMSAVAQAKPLLARILFPREAILLAKLAEVGFNTLLRLGVVGLVMLYYGVPIGVGVLPALFGVASLILLGTGLGLLLSPVGALYNDVNQGLSYLLGVWMLLTPVIYERARPDSVIDHASRWNPVTPLLTTTRQWLIGQPVGDPWPFLVVSTAAALLAVAAWMFWRFALLFVVERISA